MGSELFSGLRRPRCRGSSFGAGHDSAPSVQIVRYRAGSSCARGPQGGSASWVAHSSLPLLPWRVVRSAFCLYGLTDPLSARHSLACGERMPGANGEWVDLMTRALSQFLPTVEVSEEMEAEGQVELGTELGDLGTRGIRWGIGENHARGA